MCSGALVQGGGLRAAVCLADAQDVQVVNEETIIHSFIILFVLFYNLLFISSYLISCVLTSFLDHI